MRNLLIILMLAVIAPMLVFGQTKESFDDWQIQYDVPNGWRMDKRLGRLHVLGNGGQDMAILVAAGLYTTADESLNDLNKFAQEMGMQGYPVEQPQNTQIGGKNAVTATFGGADQFQRPLQSRFVGVFTNHGTGVNVLAIGPTAQYQQIKNWAESIAASVTANPPKTNQQMIAALSGKWIFYSGNSSSGIANSGSWAHSYEETCIFDGQGNYNWFSNSSVSADSRVTPGGYGSSASGIDQNKDQGTYTVIGNLLIMKGQHGQFTSDIVLQGNKLTAAGKTYFRE